MEADVLNLIANSIELTRAAVAELRTHLGGELVVSDGEGRTSPVAQPHRPAGRTPLRPVKTRP